MRKIRFKAEKSFSDEVERVIACARANVLIDRQASSPYTDSYRASVAVSTAATDDDDNTPTLDESIEESDDDDDDENRASATCCYIFGKTSMMLSTEEHARHRLYTPYIEEYMGKNDTSVAKAFVRSAKCQDNSEPFIYMPENDATLILGTPMLRRGTKLVYPSVQHTYSMYKRDRQYIEGASISCVDMRSVRVVFSGYIGTLRTYVTNPMILDVAPQCYRVIIGLLLLRAVVMAYSDDRLDTNLLCLNHIEDMRTMYTQLLSTPTLCRKITDAEAASIHAWLLHIDSTSPAYASSIDHTFVVEDETWIDARIRYDMHLHAVIPIDRIEQSINRAGDMLVLGGGTSKYAQGVRKVYITSMLNQSHLNRLESWHIRRNDIRTRLSNAIMASFPSEMEKTIVCILISGCVVVATEPRIRSNIPYHDIFPTRAHTSRDDSNMIYGIMTRLDTPMRQSHAIKKKNMSPPLLTGLRTTLPLYEYVHYPRPFITNGCQDTALATDIVVKAGTITLYYAAEAGWHYVYNPATKAIDRCRRPVDYKSHLLTLGLVDELACMGYVHSLVLDTSSTYYSEQGNTRSNPCLLGLNKFVNIDENLSQVLIGLTRCTNSNKIEVGGVDAADLKRQQQKRWREGSCVVETDDIKRRRMERQYSTVNYKYRVRMEHYR